MEAKKEYFSYTPYGLFYNTKGEKSGKWLPKERATISLMENADGSINYGIAICSKYDIWDKKKGRGLASKRRMERMGTIRMSDSLLRLKARVGEAKFMLHLLNTLTESVGSKISSYKHRIQAFESLQSAF